MSTLDCLNDGHMLCHGTEVKMDLTEGSRNDPIGIGILPVIITFFVIPNRGRPTSTSLERGRESTTIRVNIRP